MADWQPIESAPKDKTPVLAFRDRTESGVRSYMFSVSLFNGYDWTTTPGNYTWAPTHWMPLPNPPNSEE